MIPDDQSIKRMWNAYNLPEQKRIHVSLVARTALYFAKELSKTGIKINTSLLYAAAMLHDIDKNAEKLPGEKHPDAAVRIVKTEGFEEIARLVETHPLHSILDEKIRPMIIEEKLLYLADKMVKYEIITVDARFNLWRAENLPEDARKELEAAYPLVKNLEQEILSQMHVSPEEIRHLA